MNPSQHVRWLRRELPNLVSQGILQPEAARRIDDHYGQLKQRSGLPLALLLFSIVGAVLIGGGVILLLAHNWADLSRPQRAVVAFLPMIVGQTALAWLTLTGRSGASARESIGSFLVLAVGACVALIAQTYHLSDDFAAFMLTWMLLSLPVVYVADSVVAALFYMAGITSWAISMQSVGGQASGFWALALLLAPFGWKTIKERNSPRAATFLWGATLSLMVATGVCMEKVLPGLWIIVYSALFALFYLVGSFWFDNAESFWLKPLQGAGLVGGSILALMLSWEWPWNHVGWNYYRYGAAHPVAAIIDYGMVIALPIAALALLTTSVRRGQSANLILCALPVVAVLGYGIASLADALPTALLFSAYVFTASMTAMIKGFRSGRLASVNGGLLMLSVLLVARFFDTDLGFVARGVAFIVLGIGFFVVNIVLIRRRRETI